MTVSGRIPSDPVGAGMAGPAGYQALDRAAGGPWGAAAPEQARYPEQAKYEGIWLFTAPALDASVPQVRHAVRDLLTEQAVPVRAATADDLLLIVSELVTNAVRHAAALSPRITVEIVVHAGRVRVGVGDDHPHRPKARRTDHARTSGRGLMLVQAITGEAGGACEVEHTATGGKVVWATLPLDL